MTCALNLTMILALILAGGADVGVNYEGTWVSEIDEQCTAVINQSGQDTFTVTESCRGNEAVGMGYLQGDELLLVAKYTTQDKGEFQRIILLRDNQLFVIAMNVHGEIRWRSTMRKLD